ncbi:hypothetical protein FCH28_08285 [Streptomyces piniterrae]|uniref:Sigma-70 family RNA polymerase sigma factor n=1 Tax=Streptomyces piniterrae TaxID=2571125 RepID=A0A4U0NSA1_9ACTN|nr:hypothetical protein [Streptomyces piniterrae]TJZ57407.1 hypothetical protein FCH28_08285 [Streptomyces piniterrae]
MPSAPSAAGTTTHTTPVRPKLGEAAITVVLPADFTAFCQLHHDVYQHYAHHLVADRDAAARAVQHALGDLAASWTQALAGHHTSAIAWTALTRRVHDAARTPSSTPAQALYDLVPAPEADAAVLHRVIGLSITSTADTLGTEATAVTWLLNTFGRRLGADAAGTLRACWTAAGGAVGPPCSSGR